MPSRRQQKIARVIKESVSRTIQTRLSDPRVTGLVSVTEVDISPDSKNAEVYLSILADDEKRASRAFTAICHAAGHIQAQLGHDLTGRTCPHLLFKRDEKVKKTLETLRLIEQAQQEYREHPLVDETTEPEE
ncbi:MAG: 30S ribosome-binding factor RbfA [Planctomycetes bacterium]|nr:30S ribosome-binding factor RbfA [Planctomycetota bacterium]